MTHALGVPKRVAELVIERDKGECVAQVTHIGLGRLYEQLHHRKPRRMGGSRDPGVNLPQNLICLCRPCHEWIESHRAEAMDKGWLVRGNQDIVTTPLVYRGTDRYLMPDGTIRPFITTPWED